MYFLGFDNCVRYDTRLPGIQLDVALTYAGETVNVRAKVDTGADRCVFERRVADELGIEVETGLRQGFSTATGSFSAYGHRVILVIEGLAFDSYVFFHSDYTHGRNVLGRAGWLDRVVVGLVEYEGMLYLNRY